MGEHDGEWLGPNDGPPVSVGNQGAETPEGLPESEIAKTIRDAAREARKPKKSTRKRKPDPEAGALYVEEDGRIFITRDGIPVKPLTNFTARIVEEVILDDGENAHMVFAVEGRLADGRALPRIEVPAGSFAGMGWITAQWGVRANLQAGQSIKDHVRAALQELSGDVARRTVYSHTGWRHIDGAWSYLHSGGALTADGNRTDVEVNPGAGHMAHYRIPDPPEGEALTEAVRASLSLLDIAPHRPDMGALLLACIYRAPLAVVHPIDHAAWMVGYTGARKSEAAAMALAHFGKDFTARSFPANWIDTPANLEIKAHAAKDAVFVVDDFKPHGGKGEIDGFHSKADKLIRGVGNQAGRGRLHGDLRQRPAYHARGFVLATGEDIPRGQSLRARMTIVQLSRDASNPRQGDIDLDRLTVLQGHARAGTLARAMAGYLRWLVPQIDTLKQTLPEDIRARRDHAAHRGMSGHSRAPDTFASLTAGIATLARFAVECGALDAAGARDFEARCSGALYSLLEDQEEHQANQDEVSRFMSLLASALSSGRCHVFHLAGEGPNGGTGAPCGHRRGMLRALGWTEDHRGEHRPQGRPIGWLEGDTIYLDGEAAYATAAEYAREQGGTVEVTARTLFTRIGERGLLAKIETSKRKDGTSRISYQVNKWIHGGTRRVYALHLSALFDQAPQNAP